MDVCPASGICNLAEGFLVQFCYNYVSVFVFQKAAFNGYGLALGRPYAYCVYFYAKLCGLLCCSNGVILMIFSVRYHHYHPALFTLGAETFDTQPYGISYSGALDRD